MTDVSELVNNLDRFIKTFGIGAHPSMTWKRSTCDDGVELVHHDGDTIFFGDPNHQDPNDIERFDLIVWLANAVPAIRETLARSSERCDEAQQQIQRLGNDLGAAWVERDHNGSRADVAEVRLAQAIDALKPFAEIAKELTPQLADDRKNTMHWAVPEVGQLRRALAVVSGSTEAGK